MPINRTGGGRKKNPWEQDDLAAALDSVIGKKGYNGTTTFAGDENVDWTALARGPLTNVGAGQGTVAKIPEDNTTKPLYSSPANTIPLNTGKSKVSAGLYSGGNQPAADTVPTFGGPDYYRLHGDPYAGERGNGGYDPNAYNSGSPVDRSNFQDRAKTIANLQNDPKILALKQKIASLKAGSQEQISTVNQAYEDIIPLIAANLESQKQRTTDIYNQRGLYGSGMETGKLVQAEQEAAKAQSGAKEAQAEEIATIMRNLGMLETQTNEQIAQLEGQKGDIISQIVAELEAQADAEDQRRREAAAQSAQEAARYIDEMRQQDWTNQMREKEFNADQYWRQKDYNLDASRLAQSQTEQQDALRDEYMSTLAPADWWKAAIEDYDNPVDAIREFMSPEVQGQLAEDGRANPSITPEWVWHMLGQRFGWSIPYSPYAAEYLIGQYSRPQQ